VGEGNDDSVLDMGENCHLEIVLQSKDRNIPKPKPCGCRTQTWRNPAREICHHKLHESRGKNPNLEQLDHGDIPVTQDLRELQSAIGTWLVSPDATLDLPD